jgi:hypothetical protein
MPTVGSCWRWTLAGGGARTPRPPPDRSFRLFKQTLGWTKPRIRDLHAADRRTWLIIIGYIQLRLARGLTVDLCHTWERNAIPPDG